MASKIGNFYVEGKRKANFARKVKREVDDRSWVAEVGVEVEEQGQSKKLFGERVTEKWRNSNL